MSGNVRLADLLGGLSMVADYGFGLPAGSAVRSCLVAAALSRRMCLGDRDVRDSFCTALLMHVGCVGVAHEAAAAFGDDIALNRAEGMPAYLEASSPRNRALYERHGFVSLGAFTLPDGGPTLSRMWREPQQRP